MANAFFTAIGSPILVGTYNFGTATMDVVLYDDADDNPVVGTDDFFDDIVGAAVEADQALDSPTTTGGAYDTADEVLTSVTGDVCEGVLLKIDTAGADSTDPLVADYDTFSSGMPVTPNGGNITIQVNGSGWFAVI